MQWPENCPQFRVLDSLLQCRICYELLKNAQMTPCSHNFCSFCIRQHLTYKTECPSCFSPTEETKLRPNKLLDDIINIYPPVKTFIGNLSTKTSPAVCSPEILDIPDEGRVSKPEILASSQDFAIQPSAKKRVHVPEPKDDDSPDFQTSVPSPPKKSATTKPSNPFASTSTSSPSNQVVCPVCSLPVKTSIINLHLDACLKQKEDPKPPTRTTRKPKPLTKLVYGLMSEKELRKRLKEIGLSTQGDKKALVHRHQRYVVLYNSELDAPRPRPSHVLVKQIEREEAAEKELSCNSVSKPSILNCHRQTAPAVIEECQQAYVREHHNQFKQLVEEVKTRNNSTCKNTKLSPQEMSEAVEEKKGNGKLPDEALHLDANSLLDSSVSKSLSEHSPSVTNSPDKESRRRSPADDS